MEGIMQMGPWRMLETGLRGETWTKAIRYFRNSSLLTEEFIDKYNDKLDWCSISIYQTLSEGFIEKHVDMVNWVGISQWQILSEEFRQKHKNKII